MVGNLVVKAATRCGAEAGDLDASTRIGRRGSAPGSAGERPVGGTGEKQNRTNAMRQAASCNLDPGNLIRGCMMPVAGPVQGGPLARGEHVETDAIDFIRTLAGRRPGSGVLSNPLPL
jgi:hypothetical protein